MKLTLRQLTEVIVVGRGTCWISRNREHVAKPTISGAKRFAFNSNFGDLAVKYEDQYLGERSFLGQELVREDDNPVWGMVYHGTVFDFGDTAEDFLKQVLRTEVDRARLGEGFSVERGSLVYQSQSLLNQGNLTFVIKETIRSGNVHLYMATLAAGPIG